MSDIRTQIIDPPEVYQLKATGITDIETSPEYETVNDDLPVERVAVNSLIPNVNEIYRQEVLQTAIKTPLPDEKPKSKLPLIAAAIGAFLLFK